MVKETDNILRETDNRSRAQYYMARANTLLLMGSIFILAFVTMLSTHITETGVNSNFILNILIGLTSFGVICIYAGLGNLLYADKLIQNNPTELTQKEKMMNLLKSLFIIGFLLIIPLLYLSTIMNFEILTLGWLNPLNWFLNDIFGNIFLGFLYGALMIILAEKFNN